MQELREERGSDEQGKKGRKEIRNDKMANRKEQGRGKRIRGGGRGKAKSAH